MTTTAKPRDHALDLLRILAILMVIGIHTGSGIIYESTATESHFYQSLCWTSIFKGAVPLFVMLSGSFLLGSDRSIASPGNFVRTHIIKLLIPLLVWVPLYWLWFYLKDGTILPYVQHFGQNRGLMHMWYLVMLGGLYCVTPLLRLLIRHIEQLHPEEAVQRRILLRLTTILYLLGLVSVSYFSYTEQEQLSLLWWTENLAFFVGGYLLRRYPTILPSPRYSLLLTLLATIGIGATLSLSPKGDNMLYGFWLHNISPLVTLKAFMLFSIFLQWRPQNRILSRLSNYHSYVMGIYLVHIAVLNVVSKALTLLIPIVMDYPIIHIPLRVLLVFVLSLAVTWTMKHIPLLKKIV